MSSKATAKRNEARRARAQAKLDRAHQDGRNAAFRDAQKNKDHDALWHFVQLVERCPLPDTAIATAAHLPAAGNMQMFHTTIGDLRLFAGSIRRLLKGAT